MGKTKKDMAVEEARKIIEHAKKVGIPLQKKKDVKKAK